jgi:uncharacterized OB-fold protein
MQQPIDGVLEAPYVMEYTYRRSLGPVMSAFFTALRDGRLLGARTAAGKLVVPPLEWDPETGAAIAELEPVAEEGVVTAATWVAAPETRHLLQEPFAYALIQLDGASTAMLHAVACASLEACPVGTRVKLVWSESRTGSLRDIRCFVPVK